MHACERVHPLSHFGYACLFVTPWTVAHQVPLSMAFFRQEYWSGLPCPPPGDLPDPGIKPTFLHVSCIVGGFFTTRATWEALHLSIVPHFPLNFSSTFFLDLSHPTQCTDFVVATVNT